MTASLRRRSCPVVLAVLLAAGAAARIGAAPRPAQAATEDVTVKASLDRPAIWVADRLTYTIEIACRNGVDIVIDDLSREKLKLDGLDVAGSDTARRVEGGVIRYELRYVLTTYRVEAPIRTIAPLRIRYYVTRAGSVPRTAHQPARWRFRGRPWRSAASCPTISRPIRRETAGPRRSAGSRTASWHLSALE
ncbi:MAG TPA: hypothetical protein VF921_08165 [Vicinamibacterales bacterium]